MILVNEIAKFDFNREELVNRILEDQIDRDFVLNQILTNDDIMVYYQCFYLLQDATEMKPLLFYKYWNNIVELLYHKNSYHRDIAVTLLANLVIVDCENRFDEVLSDYLKILYDDKFKTAVSCIRCFKKILPIRIDLIGIVFKNLIEHYKKTNYSEKQEEYISGEISSLFDQVFDNLDTSQKTVAVDFICNGIKSKSPKTKKICKEIIKKRNITIAST